MRKLSLIIVLFLSFILSGCLMIPNYKNYKKVKKYGNMKIGTLDDEVCLFDYSFGKGRHVDLIDIKDEYEVDSIRDGAFNYMYYCMDKYRNMNSDDFGVCSIDEFIMSKTIKKLYPNSFGYIEISKFYYNGTLDDFLSVDFECSILNLCNEIYYKGDDGNYKLLSDISISSKNKQIKDGVFANCKTLKSVTIEDGVESIGVNSFKNCIWLESVTIPKSIKVIGEEAFSGCTNLNSITLENGIYEIDDMAFQKCSHLQKVVIPETVKILGNNIFKGCHLDTIIYNGSFENIIFETTFGPMKYYVYPDDALDAHLYLGRPEYIILPNSITKISVPFTFTSNNNVPCKVYYYGNESDWDAIIFYEIKTIYGEPSEQALDPVTENVYFYSEERPLENIENYWHYVDNVPTIWE